MTVVELKSLTRKELAQRARRGSITGWHDMKKDELIRALLNHQRNERRRTRRRGQEAGDRPSGTNGARTRAEQVRRGSPDNVATGHRPQLGLARSRDLSARFRSLNGGATDRIEARADDAYWIYAEWSFTSAAVARAEAALGIEWHRAVPIIRVFDTTLSEDGAPDGRTRVCDIVIHGGVDHWHVPVEHPARTYKLHIGYRTPEGRFYALARSRAVRTPRAGANGAVDHTWKKDTKRAKAPTRKVSRDSQPLRSGALGRAVSPRQAASGRDFPFHVDAELIVHGSTHPQAELTLLGEPVQLTRDGRFSLRFALPDGRQVIPAVTVTPSGNEQHTIVLAVERNTRQLDPQPADEPM